ncbi:MAG: PAS domain S-box protein [Candidatus Lokiarchaeota archaeon]|nr:PAS domain S-box protein [Candidatus Lokiarchaeota archaeon]
MSKENNKSTSNNVNPDILEISFLFLAILLVSFTSIYNYLLFHSIGELFSIVIAGGVFLVGWNSRKYMKSSFFLILGVSSLFIGIIDLIHTLAYPGMSIFKDYGANLATSLWIAARYLQAGSCLFASLSIKRNIKPNILIIMYLTLSLILIVLIFTNLFPLCYVEGFGLTPFKIISEYIINFILFGCLLIIIKNRIEFDKMVFTLMIISIVATMLAEIAFTFYFGVYEFPNFIGHIFKIIAFYFLYRSIIQIGIEEPFNLLFRKIKRSELELKNIIKHSGAGITMLNENGMYLLVNEKAASELGRTPNDLIGKTLYDVFPKNVADEYVISNRELIRDGIIRSYQRTLDLSSDKKTYWIVEQPIKGIDEKFSSLLSVATDITEKIKSEELVKEAEYRYRTFFEQSPDGIIILDLETLRAIEFNDVVCNMLGYSREEFEKLSINDYDALEDPSETRTHVKKVLKEGREDFETKFRTKNGELKDIYVITKTITLSGKQYFQSIYRDITDQKKAEEKIHYLSKFPSENPNPVLRVNSQRVLYSNKIAMKLFNTFDDAPLPKVLENYVIEAIDNEKIVDYEMNLNSRIYTLIISPVKNVDYVNIYAMDITERKKAEERLSQLISTVSHELRTPITVILMSIEYLTKNKENLNEDLEEKLMDGISRNVQLLNQLAEDILLISRIDEKVLILEWKEYSPFEIINEILYLMKPIGEEKNIYFKVDIDKHLRLIGDPKRIDQIFRIIIDNSIKYSDENSKVEIISINNYQGKYNFNGSQGVLFQFIDNGRGISKEDLPHIFERFFRASNVSEIAGTGLGLAIAKNLIEAHKGSIFVDSELEKGTTFHLFLPKINI